MLELNTEINIYRNYRAVPKEQFERKTGLILSTAANPLHHGHMYMMCNAYDMMKTHITQSEVVPVFELSVINADKGILNDTEIQNRTSQFVNSGYHYSYGTLPSFAAKSYEYKSIFDNYYFVIGSDTFYRMCDINQFHFGSIESLYHSMRMLRGHLIIFNRPGTKTVEETYEERLPALIYDVECSDKYRMFNNIVLDSEVSISSTEIRNAKKD